MSQIVWNDRIDAALAALLVLVVVSMIYYGVRACLVRVRRGPRGFVLMPMMARLVVRQRLR